jgi:hypothetical protein
MEATLVQLSEDQAEKMASMIKMLLLHPEQVANAVNDPRAAMSAAGLNEDDMLQIGDYLDAMAHTLRMEQAPWWA